MEKIKEIWNNRKTRGIIFIIFYICLFSYIFIVYGGKTEKIIMPENKPVKQEKKSYNSYEYTYTYEDKTINVTRSNEITGFKIDENDYYYIDGKCYILKEEKLVETEDPLKYNFDYLNNLDELKKLSNLIKTSKYADGVEEEEYSINKLQFLNLFGKTEEENTMLNYSIFFVSEKLSKISFDELGIEINYTNFENVPEIKLNYDFYESEE